MKTKLLPLVTLSLDEFRVRGPGSATERACSEETAHDNDHVVTARLTVHELDHKGWVTHNQGYIEKIRRSGQGRSRVDIANIVIDESVTTLEKRFSRIDVEIIGSEGERVQLSEKGRLYPGEFKAPTNSIMKQLAKRRINVDLVQSSICGGWDGSFLMDLSLTLSTGTAWNAGVLNNHIERAFRVTTYKASCEELSCGVAAVACAKIGSGLHRVVARVYNLTGYAECEWRAGWELPLFPRAATPQEIGESQSFAYDLIGNSPC